MRFIGITGGVGAGKTEILKYIGQHYKCEIYLADDIGHKVKEPGTEGYQLGQRLAPRRHRHRGLPPCGKDRTPGHRGVGG